MRVEQDNFTQTFFRNWVMLGLMLISLFSYTIFPPNLSLPISIYTQHLPTERFKTIHRNVVGVKKKIRWN